MNFQNPGSRLTTGNRYAQMLMNQPNANNGTTMGGLAHALRQGLAGYQMGQDRKREEKRRASIAAAMSRWLSPPPAGATPAPAPVPLASAPDFDDGYNTGMASSGDMFYGFDPIISESGAIPGISNTPQVGPAAAGPSNTPQVAPAAAGPSNTPQVAPAAAGPSNTPAANAGPQFSPQFSQMLQELAAGGNEGLALQLAMQEAARMRGVTAAETARVQGLADQKDLYKFQQDNAYRAPETVVVNGRVRLQNPDGSLGADLGPKDKPDRFVPVQGIGLYDTQTGRYVGDGGTAHNGGATGPGGLPTPQGNPTGNIVPAKRGQAQVNEYNAALATINKEREALRGMAEINRLATRFGELLDVQDTGGWQRKLPGAGMIEGALDPETEEMNSIVDKITPLMRQGLPGAASDRDVAMFRGGAMGTDKRKQTNRNIILGFQTSHQLAQDRLEFLDAYVGQNSTLRGADRAWQDYLNANPIFDPNGETANPVLNPKRRGWKEHFGSGGSADDDVLLNKYAPVTQ
jgi:hypothetical protein